MIIHHTKIIKVGKNSLLTVRFHIRRIEKHFILGKPIYLHGWWCLPTTRWLQQCELIGPETKSHNGFVATLTWSIRSSTAGGNTGLEGHDHLVCTWPGCHQTNFHRPSDLKYVRLRSFSVCVLIRAGNIMTNTLDLMCALSRYAKVSALAPRPIFNAILARNMAQPSTNAQC